MRLSLLALATLLVSPALALPFPSSTQAINDIDLAARGSYLSYPEAENEPSSGNNDRVTSQHASSAITPLLPAPERKTGNWEALPYHDVDGEDLNTVLSRTKESPAHRDPYHRVGSRDWNSVVDSDGTAARKKGRKWRQEQRIPDDLWEEANRDFSIIRAKRAKRGWKEYDRKFGRRGKGMPSGKGA